MTELLTILAPIATLLVGSYLTWKVTQRTKKQEWITEVNKQLIQRRLDAYEYIIEATKGIAVGGGSVENGELIKYPLIVVNSDYYNVWSLKFMGVATRFSHLIDSQLSFELTKLNNYLGYLSDYLGHWNDNKENIKLDEKTLKIFGQIIYDDIRKLTGDILKASGSFYSQSIYYESYLPSTVNRDEFRLPDDFKDLKLFSESEKIRKLFEESSGNIPLESKSK